MPPHHTALRSDAARLVDYVKNHDYFHDSQDCAFVRLEVSGHTEVWPVASKKLRKHIAGVFFDREGGRVIDKNALSSARGHLAFLGERGRKEEVYLRVAPHGKNILIDLCDEKWRVIEVSPDGWRVLDKSPVAFRRSSSMLALPEPVPGQGSIEPLWELLNVKAGQRPLVIGALLNYFSAGPYFVLNFVGEQGSAKSTASRITRQLIDPSAADLRPPPREERDLAAQARHNYCVSLENLSYLQPWTSDAVCRLATGGGYSARSLFTDDEEISFSCRRPVIMNGVEDVAGKPDLQDRTLQIELSAISQARRRLDTEIWQQFEENRAAIFTAILDGLSHALRELPQVKLDKLERMADGCLWATAGETAFGFERGTFMSVYSSMLNDVASIALEASPIAVIIRDELLEERDCWEGTATELLAELNALATEDTKKRKSWPNDAKVLGHHMTRTRIAPVLRRMGFEYETGKPHGRRVITLQRKGAATTAVNLRPGGDVDNEVNDFGHRGRRVATDLTLKSPYLPPKSQVGFEPGEASEDEEQDVQI